MARSASAADEPPAAAAAEDSYPLHEAVFRGDVKALSALLRKNDVAKKDRHGNTALHLAAMLGRKECAQILLAHGAPVKVKNALGWSPLAEAISYGDRPTIASLVRKLKQQAREQMEERRPNLVAALERIDDFYMALKWDFQSWVPLVSRILPSDVCRIYKSGARIRVDSTLVDFADMKWERGDVSLIFTGGDDPARSFVMIDNRAGVYQRMRYDDLELEIEDEVDVLMSSDILAAQMSIKGITFTRSQSGWFYKEDRKETVAGQFESEVYSINGLVLESRKRREHLSTDDLQKNKALMESLTKGNAQGLDANGEPVRRCSLNPPPECSVSWDEYISAPADKCIRLGRELICKESRKNFRATVAMSDDFPLGVDMLLNVLEAIAPFKHFSKLREFVALKLPSGFPVKIEIPILPTVTAKITFQECEFRDGIPPEMFQIPPDFKEDPSRFPDL